jgi:hypothetical protein
MNKVVGKKKDGGQFLTLVLEPGNIQRLREGRPITFRVEDMFPDGIPKKLDLDIFYSETPVGDARELAKMAEVALDERTPEAKSKRPHCPECLSRARRSVSPATAIS